MRRRPFAFTEFYNLQFSMLIFRSGLFQLGHTEARQASPGKERRPVHAAGDSSLGGQRTARPTYPPAQGSKCMPHHEEGFS
jgi:hypothetical protein